MIEREVPMQVPLAPVPLNLSGHGREGGDPEPRDRDKNDSDDDWVVVEVPSLPDRRIDFSIDLEGDSDDERTKDRKLP